MPEPTLHRVRPTWIVKSIPVVATLLAIAPPVHAQLMDYSALEQLFGEPVTTSVTGSPQRASDVPATMEIVTADDIRRSGATDIPGVLRHVAGVDVLQWGADQADVSLRGYNQVYSPRLLVLVDGRQVYADYYGYTPWSTLPVELAAIRQIEVVKGPNSALFGFNAAGGVINIVTYNPLYDRVNTASITGGTQALVQGSGVGTFELGGWGALRLMAGGRRNDDFVAPADIPYSDTRRGNYRGSVDASGVFRLADSVALEVGVNHVSAAQSEITAGMVPSYARYDASSVKARVTADTTAGLWQFTAYSNWLDASYTTSNISPVPLPQLTFNNNVTVLQLQNSLKVGTDHTLRASLEYRRNSVGTTPVTGAGIFYDVLAAGGMWQWQIAPNLSLTNAVRVDQLMLGRNGPVPAGYPLSNSDWNRNITALSFNSGIVWKPGVDDTLRLTVGRGVQLPNLAALGALQIQTPYRYTGVPSLSPTIVTNYELGWEHRFRSIDTTLRVSAFHQTTHNVASLSGGSVPAAGFPYLASANVMDSVASGLEVQLKGRFLTDWRWGLSYTPEIVTDYFYEGQNEVTSLTNFQSGTPVHTVNASLGWTHGRWEADAFLRYKSRFWGYTVVPLGAPRTMAAIIDYVSVDARVGYRLTDNVTLAVSAQNVMQATQQQTSGPPVERRVFGTISASF